jgi:hypothetical protein
VPSLFSWLVVSLGLQATLSCLFLVAPLHGSFYPVLVVFRSVHAGDPSGGPLMSARRGAPAQISDASLESVHSKGLLCKGW